MVKLKLRQWERDMLDANIGDKIARLEKIVSVVESQRVAEGDAREALTNVSLLLMKSKL